MGTRLRRAFSLIEVIITSSMLLLGISGLIAGVHVASRQQEHNRRVANGLIIIERRLEELLLLFPTSLLLTDGRHPDAGFELYSESGVRDAGNAFRLFYVVDFASEPNAPPEERLPGVVINVTILWEESGGERSLSLRTVR